MRLAALLAALSLTAIVGCDSAPAAPTWHDDVKPILVANCIKCHGAEPRGGSPSTIRLDRYFSASRLAEYIHVRTEAEQMPPNTRLSSRQIDVLENWANDPAEGTPPAGNSPPEMTAEVSQSNETVTIDYLITDADFDIVTGIIQATGPGGVFLVANDLHGGRGEAIWETAAIPPGAYALTGLPDDEVEGGLAELGSVTITHTDTAPTLDILVPGDKPLFSDAESPFLVKLDIDDFNVADTADVTIALVRGAERIELASAQNLIDTVDGTGADDIIPPHEIAIDTTAVPAGPGWTLVAESGNASDRAEKTVIGHGTAQTSFTPIQTILDTYCAGCHLAGAPNAAPVTFNLDEVDVYNNRGGYFFRVIQEQSMPPRSAELILDQPPMPAADREALRQWLLTAPDPN